MRSLIVAVLLFAATPPTAAAMLTASAALVPTGAGFAAPAAAAAVFCSRPAVRAFAACAGASLHAAYHVRLARREEKGVPTWRTQQALTRARWAVHVLNTEGYLYAVQTLRNAITANTFLASTQISLFTLTVGFLWQSSQSPAALALTAAGGLVPGAACAPSPAQLALVRIFLQFGSVATLLLCSAYQFLQSARLMTHAGFMFPVAAMDGREAEARAAAAGPVTGGGGIEPEDGPSSTAVPIASTVGDVMRRSELTQWAGLRFLYLAANAAVWVVGGEICFFVAAVAMVRFLSKIDRAPGAVVSTVVG